LIWQSKPHVQVDRRSGVVRKYCGERSAPVEACSTEAARHAVSTCEVPAILQVDKVENSLILSYISGLMPLASFVYGVDALVARQVMEQVGAAIAMIHRDALLEPCDRRSTRSGVVGSEPTSHGFIHGDLTSGNVHYSPTRKAIAILDWSAAPRLESDVNWGNQLWDLAWMCRSLVATAPRSAQQACFLNLTLGLLGGYRLEAGVDRATDLATALGWFCSDKQSRISAARLRSLADSLERSTY